MMIDDKTKAAVYREVADLIEIADALPSDSDTTPSDYIREKANRLDPLGSDIPDGFVWFRLYKGKWRRGLLCVGEVVNQYAGKFMIHEIEEIRPAPILEHGQVAVSRNAIVEAEDILRSELYTFAADRLQAALDRDTEARR